MDLSALIPPDVTPHGLDPAARVVVTGLTADSRRVEPGFVFAALKGVAADGRDFIPQAIANGAVAVLCAPPAVEAGAPVLLAEDPRLALAHMAGRFFPGQPATIAAITGTNGKSSTVEFLRQIWAAEGRSAAALGTLGVRVGDETWPLQHTTPDPVSVHAALDRLARENVACVALEASSHGLVQRRLDAVRITSVGFTNLSQDHLDYHPTVEAYLAAKMRLFGELAPEGAPAVVNVDGEAGRAVAETCRTRKLELRTVGWRGDFVKIREIIPRAAGQRLDLVVDGTPVTVTLPLAGEFQALNAVHALAMALVDGVQRDAALEALAQLEGVAGRLQVAGRTPEGAPVFVDYAHTPDGLDKLLRAVRPHTEGKIIVVFGCGGDRDPSKRAPMGQAAAKLADEAILTDDNPRTEDPAAIRAQAKAGCPNATEIADRAAAIAEGAARLRKGDALVIAGKGHETGQIFADRTEPFDDVEVARGALAALERAAS